MEGKTKVRDSIVCILCNCSIAEARNLPRHISRKHIEFISLRAKIENLPGPRVIAKTNDEMLSGTGIPRYIMDRYKKTLQPPITSWYPKIAKNNSKCLQKSTLDTSTILETSQTYIDSEIHVESPQTFIESEAHLELPQTYIDSETHLEPNQPSVDSESHLEPNQTSVDSESHLETNQTSVDSECHLEPTQTSFGFENHLEHSQRINKKSNNLESQNEANEKGNRKKGRQMTLSTKCQACNTIDIQIDSSNRILKEMCLITLQKDCKCSTKSNCCCRNKLNKISLNEINENKSSKVLKVTEDIAGEFVKDVTGPDCDERYFCKTCQRYGSKISSTHASKHDWVFWGYSAKDIYNLKDYMRKHLQSKQHALALATKNCPKNQKDREYIKDSNISTENACSAVQFITKNNLPVRCFESLVEYTNEVVNNGKAETEEKREILGNRHTNKSGCKNLQVACYHAARNKFVEKFNAESPITQQPPMLSISADKGTAFRDGTRQVVKMNFINEFGCSKEAFVAAPVVIDGSAYGAAESLTLELSKVCNPKNIVSISTDGASVYTGGETGMVKQLKENPRYDNRLVFLADFCHKAERLMSNNQPKWVTDTLSDSSDLVELIKSHGRIGEVLNECSNVYKIRYYTLQKMVKTRYYENTCQHIDSIFKDLPLIVESFPSLMEDYKIDDSDRNKIHGHLKKITDPVVISRLLLIKEVASVVSAMEKLAQAEDFSPFEYKSVIDELKSKL